MSGSRWAVFAATLLVVAGAGWFAFPRAAADGKDYAGVVSVERDPAWHDPALLGEAWRLPVARLYAESPEAIDFQRNPSFCGPTSVVNVVRSLGQPADQAHVLDGSGIRSYLGFLPGLTLDEEAQLLRVRTGRSVTVLRGLDLAAFRAEVARSNDPSVRYVVNFHRGPLFGRGGGHHSPIGGYLADRDLVLVLDVNRSFKPWLVPTMRLWQAVRTVDPSTKQERGLLRVE